MKVYTLKSMFDGDCVEVTRGKKSYRLHAEEIAKMLGHFTFEKEKKELYTYLINPKLKEKT